MIIEPMDDMPVWADGEEIVNSASHAVGFGMMLCIGFHLIIKALKENSGYKLFSYIIFTISMLMLFGTSMVYHGAKEGSELKKILRYFDHCSIFVGIAGSYTPIVLGIISKPMGIILFIIEWLLTIIGIFFKVCYFNSFEAYSLYFFIAMGWIGVCTLPQMLKKYHKIAFWVLLEGIVYTCGTYFYAQEKPYYHFIWHLAVIGGALCHSICVEFYL